MSNFVIARDLRRLIVDKIEQQQSTDSACAAELKAVWTRVVDASVNELDDFIASIRPGNRISAESQRLYSALFPTHSSAAWLSTQEKSDDLEEQLQKAKRFVDIAEERYASAAPLGFLSGLGKSDYEKEGIKRRKQERSSAQTDWLRLISAFEAQKLQELGLLREMLVEGMESPAFNAFAETRPKLKSVLEAAATEWSAVWKSHMNRQLESLEAIRTNCCKLEALFRQPEAESKPKLLSARDGV